MMLATAGTLLVNNVFTRIAQAVNGGSGEVLYVYQRGWAYIWVVLIASVIGIVCLILLLKTI